MLPSLTLFFIETASVSFEAALVENNTSVKEASTEVIASKAIITTDYLAAKSSRRSLWEGDQFGAGAVKMRSGSGGGLGGGGGGVDSLPKG